MTFASVPLPVQKALEDVSLPSTARLMMWHLAQRLDAMTFQCVKAASLAHEMQIRETTVGQMLTRLVAAGYLDEQKGSRPRQFRLVLVTPAETHRCDVGKTAP